MVQYINANDINALKLIDTQEYALNIPNKKNLTSFVKFIVRNNEFQINEKLYKPNIGATIGGIFSPNCSNHLSVLSLKILDKFQWSENIKAHCQYQDDGLMVLSDK